MAKEIVVKINDLVEKILDVSGDGCYYVFEHNGYEISAHCFRSHQTIRGEIVKLGQEDCDEAEFILAPALLGRFQCYNAGDLKLDYLKAGFMKNDNEQLEEVRKMLQELFCK